LGGGAVLNLLKFFHLASIVSWVGTIAFFSFFAAPAIFKALDRESAGRVVGAIFPGYWMVGYVAGVVSVLTLIITAAAEREFPFLRLVLLIAMTALWFYAGLVVGREAGEARAQMKEADGEARERLEEAFDRLHQRSVTLNASVFVLGVFVVYLTALRL